MSQARYWQAASAPGDVVCTLCPHRCALRPGATGRCGARANVDGRLELLTWGRNAVVCIDPIEKKPLYHFLPGTPTLSFGGFGCNLSCSCCQNWELSRHRGGIDRPVDTPEAIAAAAVRKGCRSVAMTYNEPAIALEYASAVADACRAVGVRPVGVSAGYVSEAARPEFFRSFDAVNIDLKAFSESFYKRHCHAHLAPVLETLKYAATETRTWVEVTTLLIPGLNDGDAEVAALARWIAEEMSPTVPLHLSAFHPDHKLMDVPPTPPATLRRARAVARAEGLAFVYTGNIDDPEGETTLCPGCGAPTLRRDRYEILGHGLDPHGRCVRCDTQLPGVFDGPPGNWGRRRQAVIMPAPH
jgi:pyruvate formate lyase activating enzyme